MAAIREATRAELAEHGYWAVTFEGVARRARTSKHVLYRRYRSRAHMVLDAVPTFSWQPDRTIETRSLREDLLALLRASVDRAERIGLDTYRAILSEVDDELFHESTIAVSQQFSDAIRAALTCARERGEIGPAPIPEAVVRVPIALLRNELLIERRAVNRTTLIELVDTIFIPLVIAVSQDEAAAERLPGVPSAM